MPKKNILLLLTLLICFVKIYSQKVESDFDLLINKSPEVHKMHEHKPVFGIANNKNSIIKYNPITLSFSALMYGYQRWLSPQISSNCYFEPTCSRYSKILYRDLGLLKGTLATADRLMRCDRISATSFNPISINKTDGKIHETSKRYIFHDN